MKSRHWGRDALTTFTLYGLAVAQPLYDLLSRGPEFLLAHRLESGDLLVLTAIVSFGPPSALVLGELAERRLAGTSRLHLLWVALLSAAIALGALRALPTAIALATAVGSGSLVAWMLSRSATVRLFMAFLWPAILIIPMLLLLRPPVVTLLLPQSVEVEESSGPLSDIPVVMIVLDELPISSLMDEHHRIDRGRYPAFAELADHSIWFRNATSVAKSTAYAVPAILTGRYPDRPRVAHVQDYPENLFTWLAASGYSLNVFESFTRMCPEELCQSTGLAEDLTQRLRSTLRDLSFVYLHILLPERLTAGLPAVTATWRDFSQPSAAEVPAETPTEKRRLGGASAQDSRLFVESIRPTGQPALHFLHVNLPHLPWKYLPSGKEYGPPGGSLRPPGTRGEYWDDDEWATTQGFQRHLLQLVYTDRLLGRWIGRLRETGLYDRALVIVTADHGVCFWPGLSRRGASEASLADVLSVPLFVKKPFQTEGVLSGRNVETIDILPTIADVLGVELSWPVDGRSALDEGAARAAKTLTVTRGKKTVERVVLGERIEGLDATLRRMHTLFGSGADLDALFRIGRYRQLVGRRVAEQPLVSGSGMAVELVEARTFESCDPDSGYVPAQIVGRLRQAAASGPLPHLAVAVNGRIRAVTQARNGPGGGRRFFAMVPEASFRRGFNQVEVLEILGGEPIRLAAVASRPAVHYRLHLRPDGSAERITSSDGRSFRIVPGALSGEVIFTGLRFRGWAADPEAARIAESIFLFSGTEFVTRAATGARRPEIAERFQQQALLRAGFNFVLPNSMIGAAAADRLRFFAAAGDVATAITYSDAWAAQRAGQSADQPP